MRDLGRPQPAKTVSSADLAQRSKSLFDLNTALGWQPLHLQVRNALLERIAAGEWAQGSPLPSEFDFAQEYGLSTGTIRKALDWLDQSRILVRRQGRGTFVRDQSAAETEARYEKLCKADGSAFGDFIEKISRAEAVADDDECARLKVTQGALVWRVECLRTVEGRPHILELLSLPRVIFSNCGSGGYSLAKLAVDHGLLLGQASERVSSELPPQWVAERLGAAPDRPMMVLDRVINTIQGKPIEWRKCYCATPEAHYMASID